MSTIVTRSGKGSPLTHNEVDANFTNLNSDKYQSGDAATFASVTIPGEDGTAILTKNTSITSWLYSGKSFSILGEESNPCGLFLSPDGLNMYVNGTSGDDVNQYVLSAAWDVATASYVRVFSTAAQDTLPNDIFFKPDGLTMFVMGQTTDTVYQYTLTTAWNISTASYASKSFSVTTQEATPTGLWFKPDGLTMYVIGTTADTVFQYTLGTAWDVSTASYTNKSYSVATQEATPQQINLSSDGTTMYVLGSTGDDIWEYTLGTAWDISTATPVNNFYVGFQAGGPTGMFIDGSAANRVFIVDSGNDAVYQYNTATNSVDFSTDKFYTPGTLSVNGNFVAGANAYVDGTLVVQGSVTLGSMSTFSITAGGTMALGTGTGTVTNGFSAGATTSGSTKTVNIGTAGLSGSTTAINIGSSVSGSLGTTTISAPTVNIGQTATQFSVTNTASAVNFVQVTGAATTQPVVIGPQGSDTNVGMLLRVKGAPTGPGFRVENNNGSNVCFAVTTSGANVVNYIRADPAAAGSAAGMSAQGSDTNIDLALTPKGTGLVRFGTRTASADAAITGYIEIKDSGGTTRRLAVIG